MKLNWESFRTNKSDTNSMEIEKSFFKLACCMAEKKPNINPGNGLLWDPSQLFVAQEDALET